MADLITLTDAGLYCAAGDFHIDPWKPVPRALITHAHGDHARPESGSYLCTAPSVPILKKRLGDVVIDALAYGEVRTIGGARVSFHPAGHVLGSAQILVDVKGERWVASGDYKRDDDPTCAPFEVVRCDTFITEATFGLPIYRWEKPRDVVNDIHAWWRDNASQGRASVLFVYALGKAQRVLAGLAELTDEPVMVHGAIDGLNPIYVDAGVRLLPTMKVSETQKGHDFSRALILAPPSSSGSTWMRRFGDSRTAFASGWMRVRGTRRRQGFDRGFVLSDHADWPSLLKTIAETGASRILVTHGSTHALARFLVEKGVNAAAMDTDWHGETED